MTEVKYHVYHQHLLLKVGYDDVIALIPEQKNKVIQLNPIYYSLSMLPCRIKAECDLRICAQ